MTAWPVLVLVTVLVAAPGCTGAGARGEPPAERGRPAATVRAGAEDEDPHDRALGDRRSLLAFLPDSVTNGQFVVRPLVTDRDQRRWRGVFWRTASGNVYTQVRPYDRDLVRREVTAFYEHQAVDGARCAGLTRQVCALVRGEFYTGDEFQFTLDAYLARALGSQELTGLELLDSEEPKCAAAFDEHRAAVRRALAALTPAWAPARGRDRWQIQVTPLRRATRETRHAVERACTGRSPFVGPADDEVATAAVEVERWPRGVTIRTVDDHGDLDHHLTAGQLTIEVTPGHVGAPPPTPDPAPADDVVRINDFLLAVNACRGLPWEYGNFAASDNYDRPAEHRGPSPFSDGWFCEHEVPPDRRTDEP